MQAVHDTAFELEGKLVSLNRYCAERGLRFPRLAARLACRQLVASALALLSNDDTPHAQPTSVAAATEGSRRVAACSGPPPKANSTRSSGQQHGSAHEASAAERASPAVLQGDALADLLPFLCYARTGTAGRASPPGCPPDWQEQWFLLHRDLEPFAAELGLRLALAPAVPRAWGTSREVPVHHGSEAAAAPGTGEGAAVNCELLTLEGRQQKAGGSPRAGAGTSPMVSPGGLLDLEWYARVLARLHVNAFRVDTVAPLPSVAAGSGALMREMVAAVLSNGADPGGAEAVGSSAPAAGLLPYLGAEAGAGAGSAVYLVASLANHACEPNLDVVFPRNDGTIVSVLAPMKAAQKTIETHKTEVEMCPSYLEWESALPCAKAATPLSTLGA
jgi:hypothetical protein